LVSSLRSTVRARLLLAARSSSFLRDGLSTYMHVTEIVSNDVCLACPSLMPCAASPVEVDRLAAVPASLREVRRKTS
jgi:hypothetical protein